jgi:hypothetical protein
MIYSCICCFTACIFITYMIYTNIKTQKHQLIVDFQKSLSNTENNIYKKIVQERKTIYVRGFLLGIASTIILLWGSILFTKYVSCGKSICLFLRQMAKANKLCLGIVVTFVVTYGYYMLSPKSDYMILHLNDKEKRQKWLEVYKYMQSQHHYGFVYGLLGAAFLSIMF